MTSPPQESRYLSRGIDYLGDLGAKLRELQGYATLAHELLPNADDAQGVSSFTFDVRQDALAEAGIAKVVALEQSCNRHPEVKPPRHEGYDIESRDAAAEIVRYIEVKSISGLWDARGVGVTRPEFEEAQQLGDKFWLYIVERADQPDARIYQIRDPARKVDQFMYDDGWSETAENP